MRTLGRFSVAIAVAFLLLAGTAAFAQENPFGAGRILVAASVTSGGLEMGSYASYDSSGNEITGSKNNTLVVGVSTQLGYFLINGLEIGPAVQLTYANISDASVSNSFLKDTTLGFGAQIGYFQNLGSFSVFAMVVGLYKTETQEIALGGPSTTTTTSGFQITPEAGAAFFLTSGVALQVGAFFNYASSSASGSTQSTRTISYGVKVGVGVFL